eukprot:CAMPEP_0116061024 /NCGR_PEP_ID=MMETSP0322-20121206/6801_1 /TAXON_ID=163516 /ORGANISM="Leptocylindrus danicus var. apora, Strain B651" /LENGTH=647 /DNA_ID=CAMNT_0003545829 /DNA_START=110 /DNA_END=2053 /DNA_ORIENTATION=-
MEGAAIQPNDNDVLFGRGNFVNRHKGNLVYRQICREAKAQYIKCSKLEKKEISVKIVKKIRALDPPGRFLKRNTTGVWFDVGDQEAREKTSQTLRDCDAGKGDNNNGVKKALKAPKKVRGHSRKQTAPGRIQNVGLIGGGYDFGNLNIGTFHVGGFVVPSPPHAVLPNGTIPGVVQMPPPPNFGLQPNWRQHMAQQRHESKTTTSPSNIKSSKSSENLPCDVAEKPALAKSTSYDERYLRHSTTRQEFKLTDDKTNVEEGYVDSFNRPKPIQHLRSKTPRRSPPIEDEHDNEQTKRGHSRKRTAPGRIETDMLFPNLFDQIGAISDNNILNPSIQGTSTNDGRMEVDPKIPPKPEMPSSQEKVFQPSGLPGVPEKKVWDGSQGSEFFDNSILLSSSEEKKSTQSVLPGVCEERICDGPDEFDFSLESLIDQSDLQLQRARKKHIRRPTAPGRIEHNRGCIKIDDVALHDEIEWNILNELKLTPCESPLNTPLLVPNSDLSAKKSLFSNGTSKLNKPNHRRKRSTPGRMENMFLSSHQNPHLVELEKNLEHEAPTRKYFNKSTASMTNCAKDDFDLGLRPIAIGSPTNDGHDQENHASEMDWKVACSILAPSNGTEEKVMQHIPIMDPIKEEVDDSSFENAFIPPKAQ